jgi:hypothetical protein
MKTFKIRFKYLPVALAMLMLLQGCTVYKKQNVTMQAAAQEQVKTKVKTVNGNFYFKYITVENDQYFGIKKSKGEIEKTRLDPKSIEKIQLKNKQGSVIVSILVPVGLIIGAVLILGSIAFGSSSKGLSNSNLAF